MRIPIFLIALLLLVASSFTVFRHSDQPAAIAKATDSLNYLAIYGKYVYTVSGCAKCHSFYQTNSKDTISLDGVGQNYSAGWMYRFLVDPRSMLDMASMQSYQFLNTRFLDKNTYRRIGPDKEETEWDQLLQQANALQKELISEGAVVKPNTQMIALIAYLRSVEPSEALKKIRKRQDEIAAEETKRWDSLLANPASLLYESIRKPGSAEAGKEIYHIRFCSACHGANGEGGVGPNLTDDYWLHGSDDKALLRIILYGEPDKGMQGFRYMLSPEEAGQTVAYIKSLRGTNPPNQKAKQGVKE